MVTIIHTPTKDFVNHYLIQGDNIKELISECIKKVRPKSAEFYTKELQKDLSQEGKSVIDHHAGMGYFYTVKLTK